MIEQVIGVTCGMAIRKVICVMKKPRKDASSIRGRSRRATFSLRADGRITDRSQNMLPAPSALRLKMPSGVMTCPAVRSLHVMMFTPKIA